MTNIRIRCFYINLPIGAITIVVIGVFFKSPKRKSQTQTTWKQKLAYMDPIGTAVFIPAIVCCLLALQWGGTKYPWSNPRIIVLFVLFGVLSAVFVGVQFWKGDDATVPPRIMKQRTMAAASWFALCLGAAFFIFMSVSPSLKNPFLLSSNGSPPPPQIYTPTASMLQLR